MIIRCNNKRELLLLVGELWVVHREWCATRAMVVILLKVNKGDSRNTKGACFWTAKEGYIKSIIESYLGGEFV